MTGCGASALRLRTPSAATLFRAVCFAYFCNTIASLLHPGTVRFVGKGPGKRTVESQTELSAHSPLVILEASVSSRPAVPSN